MDAEREQRALQLLREKIRLRKAAVGNPQGAIVAPANPDWKRIGMYKSEPGELLVVVGKADGIEVLKEGEILPDVQMPDLQTLQHANKVYTRVHYTDAVLGEFAAAKGKAATRGMSGRTVYIGDTVVFKNSFDSSFTEASVIQEASRNLFVISKGLSHAECYGIHQDEEGKFYFIEALLDIERSDHLYLAAAQYMVNIPGMYTLFPASLDLSSPTDKADYLELISLPFSIFVTEFTKLRDQLIAHGVGGDFKLDNLAFKRGTIQLVFTDLLFPSTTNPYRPKSWTDWSAAALAEEGNLSIFTNPFKRLGYWAQSAVANKVAAELTKEFPGKAFAAVAKWKVPEGAGAAVGGKRNTRRIKKFRRGTLRR